MYFFFRDSGLFKTPTEKDKIELDFIKNCQLYSMALGSFVSPEEIGNYPYYYWKMCLESLHSIKKEEKKAIDKHRHK